MRAAIIGCGRTGRKRSQALSGCRLTVCCDTLGDRAQAPAKAAAGAVARTDWQAAVNRPDVDVMLVAATHDMLARIACAAAATGKHVLMEKPGARRTAELDPVRAAASRTSVRVRVGFNRRYHRALPKTREILDSGALGDMMFVRGRYGHAGRPGYDKEGRAFAALAGGGELVDQGMRLIDLARWFLADFEKVQGHIATLGAFCGR